jgi:purine-cytosine permease-like protein
MGPGTGLRQVSISRYSMGWWPAKLIAALNVVEQVGWSSVGSITGGLALSAVSDGRIGSELGVVIAAVLGFVVSFVGLKAVFTYEKFAGLVMFVVFIVMYGMAASSGDAETPTKLSGSVLSGTALTLFAVVYGSSASWCSIVADYYVEYPVNTSKVKVFLLTTFGICKFAIDYRFVPVFARPTIHSVSISVFFFSNFFMLTQSQRHSHLFWHDPRRSVRLGPQQ